MKVIVLKRYSRDKQKIWYSLGWGTEPGQRNSTGIFTYSKHLYTKSKKTGAELIMKLPDYAIDILKKYFKIKNSKQILPKIRNTNLNKNIKKLLEKGHNNQHTKTAKCH